jgi:hypothetical protein
MVRNFEPDFKLDVERIMHLIPSIDEKENVKRMLGSMADLMQVDCAICNSNVCLTMSQLKSCF